MYMSSLANLITFAHKMIKISHFFPQVFLKMYHFLTTPYMHFTYWSFLHSFSHLLILIPFRQVLLPLSELCLCDLLSLGSISCMG